MKKHKRLLVFQCKYTKTPMSKFECFGHAVKGAIPLLNFLHLQKPTAGQLSWKTNSTIIPQHNPF